MDQQLKDSPLWPLLVDTARSLPLFRQHRNYVRENMLSKKPDISAEEVSERLSISLGEALVIMEELSTKA
jgi:hypothetical protein